MTDYRQAAKSWVEGNFDDETKAEVKRLMEELNM